VELAIYHSLNGNCANHALRWRSAFPGTYQPPSRRFCLEGNPSRDHAQFTVTVTAVVALMAPLEPVTVTV
jgi:hypothetical protein